MNKTILSYSPNPGLVFRPATTASALPTAMFFRWYFISDVIRNKLLHQSGAGAIESLGWSKNTSRLPSWFCWHSQCSSTQSFTLLFNAMYSHSGYLMKGSPERQDQPSSTAQRHIRYSKKEKKRKWSLQYKDWVLSFNSLFSISLNFHLAFAKVCHAKDIDKVWQKIKSTLENGNRIVCVGWLQRYSSSTNEKAQMSLLILLAGQKGEVSGLGSIGQTWILDESNSASSKSILDRSQSQPEMSSFVVHCNLKPFNDPSSKKINTFISTESSLKDNGRIVAACCS